MSGKTKKIFSKINFVALLIFAFVFFAVPSCEVGLGPAVDTEVPELHITQPTNDTAPIRGDFLIKGTCKDDGTIGHMEITLKGLDSDKNDKFSKTYSYKRGEGGDIKLAEDAKSWECPITPQKSEIMDGSYEVTVVIADTYEHKTTDKITIKIDNTPPILVLQRPSTIFSSTSPDTYGQEFTLEGQAADDSDVGKIEVLVYTSPECADADYFDTITLEKIPPTVDVTVMQWKEVGDANESAYNRLYGADKKAGTKKYYCKIVAYDDARPCPNEGEGKDKGNKIDYYYLYNDIFSSVLSYYKLTQVYSIMNGTYKVSDDRAAVDTLASVKATLASEDVQIKKGSFALNPLNNPTFSLNGYDPIKKRENGTYTFDEAPIINGSMITVKVSSGLDKIPLRNDTIGVSFIPVNPSDPFDSDGNVKIKEGEEEVQVFLPAVDKQGNAVITEPEKITERESQITNVGSYDRTVNITLTKGDGTSGLKIGSSYIMNVTAYDERGNNAYNLDKSYGINFISMGVAPSMDLTSPENTQNFVNDSGVVKFEGTTEHEEGTPIVSIFISGIENPIYGPIPTNKIDFDFKVADYKQYLGEGSNTIIIRSDYNGKAKEIERTVTYDVKLPEVNFTKVTPAIAEYTANGITKKNCVNGIVTVAGTIFDENSIKSAKYVIKGGSKIISEDSLDAKKTNFELKIDTLKAKDGSLVDDCELIVEITATDNAGNTLVKYLLSDDGTNYNIWQESDKPAITVIDISEPYFAYDISNPRKKISGLLKGATMNYALSDDDGLKNVTAYIYRANKTTYALEGDAVNKNNDDCVRTFNNGPTASCNVTVPGETGFYWVIITASDNVQNRSSDATQYGTREYRSLFKVESGAPTILITSGETQYVAASDTANGRKTIDVMLKLSGETDDDETLKVYITLEADKDDESKWKTAANVLYDSKSDANFKSNETFTTTVNIPGAHFKGKENNSENRYILVVKDARTTQEGTALLKVIVDNDTPTISNAKGNFKDNTNITNSSFIKFTGQVADSKSGVKAIYYKRYTNKTAAEADKPASLSSFTTEANGWVEASRSGTSDWNTSQDEYPEGMNQAVSIYAVDEAENFKGEIIEFSVDTKAPEISGEKVSDNEINLDDIKKIDTTPITIKATIKDVTSGIKTVSLYEGETDLGLTPKQNGDEYTFTLPKDFLDDGTHNFTVRATDVAGNVKSGTTQKISVDQTPPEVVLNGSGISPIYSESGSVYTVNGKIKVSGTVSDNLALGSEIEYTIKGDGKTDNIVSEKLALSNGNNKTSAKWDFVIDTTEQIEDGSGGKKSKFADTKTYVLTISVTDAKGNKSAGTELKFNPNQSTDKPIFTFTNFDNPNLTDKTQVGVGNNLFGMGINTIYGSVTDDDGLKEVIYYIDPVFDADKKITSYTTKTTINPSNSKSKALTIDLKNIENEKPDGTKEKITNLSGVHTLYVVATDIANKLDTETDPEKTLNLANPIINKTVEIAFAMDDDVPDIIINEINDKGYKDYSSGMWAKKDFAIKGEVSDKSGVKELTVNLTKKDDSDDKYNSLPYYPKTMKDNSTASTPVTSQGLTFERKMDDGSYKCTFYAKDIYGRETESETFAFRIDTTLPVLDASKISFIKGTESISLDKYDGKTWVTTTLIKFEGSAGTDAGGTGGALQEVNKSSVTITAGSAKPINADFGSNNSFSANVVVDGDGEGIDITIEAEDLAGNKSNKITKKFNVDTEKPDVISAIVSDFTDGKIIKAGTKIKVKAQATDKTSKVQKILVGNKEFFTTAYGTYEPKKEVDGVETVVPVEDTNEVEIEVDTAGWTTGEYTLYVRAVDVAGNVSDEKPIENKIKIDETKPVVKITGYTPYVTESSVKKVNGKITVTGTVSDNYALASSNPVTSSYPVTLTVTDGDSKEKTYYPTPVSGGTTWSADGTDWVCEINTAELFKDKDFATITVSATDSVGNESDLASTTIYIDQSTDRPKVTLTGRIEKAEEANLKDYSASNKTGIHAGYCLLNKDEQLTFTLEDDDGIGSYKVSYRDAPTIYKETTDTAVDSTKVYYKKNGEVYEKVDDPKGSDIIYYYEEAPWIKIEEKPLDYNPTKESIYVSLPNAIKDGRYELKIEVEDYLRETKKGYYYSQVKTPVEGDIENYYEYDDTTKNYNKADATFDSTKTYYEKLAKNAKDEYKVINGNDTSKHWYFGVSSGAPTVKISTNSNEFYSPSTSKTINGTITSGVGYTLTTTHSDGTLSVTDKGWTYAFKTDSSEGTKNIEFTATNIFGQTTSPVATFTYKIDTSAPTDKFTDEADLVYNSATKANNKVIKVASKTFDGISDDGSGDYASGTSAVYYQVTASTVTTTPDNSATTGWARASGEKNWSVSLGFEEANGSDDTKYKEGSHKLWVYSVDKAGNKSNPTARAFDVDLEKPTVTISGESSHTSKEDYRMTFAVADSSGQTPFATVEVKKDGTTLTADSDYKYTESPKTITISHLCIKTTDTSPVKGKTYYTVKSVTTPVADNIGNYFEKSTNDLYKATTDILLDTSKTYYIALVVSEPDEAEIGTYFEINDGTYTITVTATDWVNRTTTETFTVTKDTTPPVIKDLTTVSTNWQKTNSIYISGTAEDKSKVKGVYYIVTIDDTTTPSNDWSAWTSAGTESFAANITGLSEGTNYIWFGAEDENTAKSTSDEIKATKKAVKVDTKAPTILGLSLKRGDTEITTLNEAQHKAITSDNSPKVAVSAYIADATSGIKGINLTGTRTGGSITKGITEANKGASAYLLTADTEIEPGKTYYTQSGTSPSFTYTAVASPADTGLSTYYEKCDLYTFYLAKSDLDTGDYTFKITATDNAGNSTDSGTKKLTVDLVGPTVDITTITPDVELAADNVLGLTAGNYLNGKIKIAGTVEDANTTVTKVEYKIYKGSSASGTPSLSGSTTGTSLTRFTFDNIDTTAIKDGADNTKPYTGAVYIEVIATDQVGNETKINSKQIDATHNTTVNTSYIVNQETDRPRVKPTNFDMKIEKEWVTVDETVTNKKPTHIFGTSSNRISATIEDDDGIGAITVAYYLNDAATATKTSPFDGGGKTTYTLSDTLPTTEGLYKVVISAKDKVYTSGTSDDSYNITNDKDYTTWLGVSRGAPTISITSPTSGGWYSSNDATANEISATFSVTSGTTATVTGTIVDTTKGSDATALSPTYTYSAVTATGSETITVPSKFNKTVGSTATETSVTNGDTITVMYTVTDIFNQTASDNFTYRIDNAVPDDITNEITVGGTKYKDKVNNADYTADKWINSKSVKIDGHFSDAQSGVNKIYAWVAASQPAATVGLNTSNAEFVAARIGNSEYYKFSGTIDITGTDRNIYLMAVDAVGNRSSFKTFGQKLDTKDPEIFSWTVDSTASVTSKLVNGKNNITFIVTPTDNVGTGDTGASGIASVLCKFGDYEETLTAANSGSTGYEFVIPSSKLTRNGGVSVTVTDNAGNSIKDTVFNITLDNSDPTVTLTPFADADEDKVGKQVNKTIYLSGSANDNNTLSKKPVFYYSTTAPSKTEGITAEDWSKKDTSNKEIGMKKDFTALADTYTSGITNFYNWTTSGINTTTVAPFSSGGKVYLIAEVEDAAGNKGYSKVVEIDVDQDSDRPVITLSNISQVDGAILGQKTVYGIAKDDDGDLKGLWYINEADYDATATLPTATNTGDVGNWKKIPITNGNWTVSSSTADDGLVQWRFYAIDKEGTSFSSVATATDRIYVKFAGDGNSKVDLATDIKDASDAVVPYNGIKFYFDTTAPRFVTLGYKKEATTGTTISATAYAADATKNTGWTESNGTFVGGDNGKLYVKIALEEAVGMDETNPITFKIGDKTYTYDKTSVSPIYSYREVSSFDVKKLSEYYEKDSSDNYKKTSDTSEVDEKTYYEREIGGYSVSLKNGTETLECYESISGSNYTYIIGPIDMTAQTGATYNFDDGQTVISVTAKDKSEKEREKNVSITVDNSCGTVRVSSPAETTKVTRTISWSGTYEDNAGGSGNAEIYWYIPEKGVTTPTKDTKSYKPATALANDKTYYTRSGDPGSYTYTEVTSPIGSELSTYYEQVSAWNKIEGATASWAINFDSAVPGSLQNPMTYINGAYEVSGNVDDNGLYEVPMWFMIKDQLGNTKILQDENTTGSSTSTHKFMLVDKYGGWPTASISYPTEGSYGGRIRVNGTSFDVDGTIQKVHLQIDTDGDNDFDDADYNKLKSWADAGKEPYKSYLRKETEKDEKTGETENVWYLDIPDVAEKQTWNISINQTEEFTELLNGSISCNIGLRVRAFDNDNHTHGWYGAEGSDEGSHVSFIYATDIPQFDSVVLKSTDGKKEMPYTLGTSAWLSGEWYLEGVVYDSDGISEISINASYGNGKISGVSYTEGQTANLPTIGSGDTEFWGLEEENAVYRLTTDTEIESGKTYYTKEASTGEYSAVDTADLGVAYIGTYYENKGKGYKFKIKINEDLSSNGYIYSTISACDKASNPNKKDVTFEFRIDNDAPLMNPTTGNATNKDLIGNLKVKSTSDTNPLSDSVAIVQSNSSYTFGDVVTDVVDARKQNSGIDKLVFYFKRDLGGSTKVRVYDPMRTSSEIEVSDTSGVKLNEEGLPVITISGSTSGSTFTASSVLSNTHIRTGGLVKIAGAYYTIDGIDDTDGVVSLKKKDAGGNYQSASFATASDVSAEFVYAQVLDKLDTVEITNSTVDDDGNLGVSNDDGDGMRESFDSSSGEWQVTINSKNINDGPIELHVLAFDRAGNISHGSVNTSVQNNRPRLASVRLATDINGNGKFDYTGDNSGEFRKYTTLQEVNGTQQTSHLATLNSAAFKAKDGLLILPEFVNDVAGTQVSGNGDIKYYMTIADGQGDSYNLSEPVKDITPIALTLRSTIIEKIENKTDNSSFDKKTLVSEKGGLWFNGNEAAFTNKDGPKTLQISFWDSTEGLDAGSTSQWSHVNIPITIAFSDREKPRGYIAPFYWKSKEYNSLQGNSTANGHIELVEDWKQARINAAKTGSGITIPENLDNEHAKVSGNIVVRGFVYDNRRLSSFTVNMGNKPVGTATYDPSAGTWSTALTADNGGLAMFVYDGINTKVPTNMLNSDFGGQDNTEEEKFGPEQSLECHKVFFEMTIDTSKCDTNQAATGVEITLSVEDAKNNSAITTNEPTVALDKTAGTETVTSSVTNPEVTEGNDAEKLKTKMTVDVVPYVTKVTTGLSSVKTGYDGSIYNRTALGHYPVTNETYNSSHNEVVSTDAMETITLTGFNLGTNTSIDAKNLDNGKYDVVVNSVKAVNNYNNNDAHGSAADDSDYDEWYNRYQNKANNNELTDDIEFDVWEFNSSAASSYDGVGVLREPIMKINPSNGIVGFAFGNGPTEFSMSGGKNSYNKYQSNFATFINVSFAYDEAGRSHGTATGIDTYKNQDKGGRFTYFTGKWGPSTASDNDNANFDGNHANRIESIGLPSGTEVNGRTLPTRLLLENRFFSPSIAVTSKDASSNDGNTRVYLAYYDDVYNQIRFRAGTNNSESGNSTFGQIFHRAGSGVDVFVQDNCSIIAGQTGRGTYLHSTVRAGDYVSIAVIPGNTANDDVVVATWFDASNNSWMYSYNTNPNYNATTDYTWDHFKGHNYKWSSPQRLSPNAGEYCKIAVAPDNSIHIACKSQSNEIMYSYLKSYSSEPTTVKVDTYEGFVQGVGIDAEVIDSKAVPYISYWANGKPKLAFPANATTGEKQGFASGSDVKAGVTGASFNRNWEVTYIPTRSSLIQDHINVASVSSAIATMETSVPVNFHAEAAEDGSTRHTVFTNGSTYPIMGYGIRKGTSGFIEIAQRLGPKAADTASGTLPTDPEASTSSSGGGGNTSNFTWDKSSWEDTNWADYNNNDIFPVTDLEGKTTLVLTIKKTTNDGRDGWGVGRLQVNSTDVNIGTDNSGQITFRGSDDTCEVSVPVNSITSVSSTGYIKMNMYCDCVISKIEAR